MPFFLGTHAFWTIVGEITTKSHATWLLTWDPCELDASCFRGTSSHSGGFPVSLVVKDPPVNAGDMGLIPGSERSTGEGSEDPLQYSCLENPMDRGAWWDITHGITKE